jgi:hypothetical protein
VARKFLYVVASAVVLVLLAALALRLFPEQLTRLAFEPSRPFETAPPLRPADYARGEMWLESQVPGAEKITLLPTAAQPVHNAGPAAAVFLIPPTTYLDRAHWNAPLAADPATEERNREAMRLVAEPFGIEGDLWVPRYRQATFGAILSERPAATQALDLAYRDVLAAFDHFLAVIPPDRPIVLAGHSQGALHLKRLLKDRVARQPLKARIAAAYVIGWGVSPQRDLPAMGLPACAGPDQPGCVMSWLSFAEPADPAMARQAFAHHPALDGGLPGSMPPLCTNPLTGGGALGAAASANLGTLVPDGHFGKLVPGLVPARCSADGLLLIGPPPAMGSQVLPGNNYQAYDVALFWANVRADMARRVASWRTRF